MKRSLVAIAGLLMLLGFSVTAAGHADRKSVIKTVENYLSIAGKYNQGNNEEVSLAYLYLDMAEAKLKTAGLTPESGDEVKKLYDRIAALRTAAEKKKTGNAKEKARTADPKTSPGEAAKKLDMARRIAASVEAVLPQLTEYDRQMNGGSSSAVKLARHRSNVIRAQYALADALKLSEQVKSEESALLSKKIRGLQTKVNALYMKTVKVWNDSRGKKEF